MSTFSGVVSEFPSIRIDNFTSVAGAAPPLAYFVSHIHSDHIVGLAAYKSPTFIYCSATTKDLLLKLETFSNRQNFDNGITETKNKHLSHLESYLRPLPLNTPTNIQLTPREAIRVTLFDANHCPGAVMFLIEGSSISVLYTGDIRAEKWWLDSFLRSPYIIPYASGFRRLHKIYLDTTHANDSRVDSEFPSKAEGMRTLLNEVMMRPSDQKFHINTWTYGYEEALSCLAAAFSTKVHVGRFIADFYKPKPNSLTTSSYGESPYMTGFQYGRTKQSGFLTTDETARFHACNPVCDTAKKPGVVRIVPTINRNKYEIGAPLPTHRKQKSRSEPHDNLDVIVFPFARHSSFDELLELVKALRPNDVYPCVTGEDWGPDRTIENLFGDLCAQHDFSFDLERAQEQEARAMVDQETQVETQYTAMLDEDSDDSGHPKESQLPSSFIHVLGDDVPEYHTREQGHRKSDLISPPSKRQRSFPGTLRTENTVEAVVRNVESSPTPENPDASPSSPCPGNVDIGVEEESQQSLTDTAFGSQTSLISDPYENAARCARRRQAYEAAKDPDQWVSFSTLSSSGRFEKEEELG